MQLIKMSICKYRSCETHLTGPAFHYFLMQGCRFGLNVGRNTTTPGLPPVWLRFGSILATKTRLRLVKARGHG